MKKISILLAIAALVAGAASCNKIENNNVDSGIKVNIAVSDLTPGTKAIKSGWSDGDIINVYLNDATSYVPDFQLTYSGGNWGASTISDAVVARLQPSGGTLQGFWEGSNSAISGSGWESRNNNHTSFTIIAKTRRPGKYSILLQHLRVLNIRSMGQRSRPALIPGLSAPTSRSSSRAFRQALMPYMEILT